MNSNPDIAAVQAYFPGYGGGLTACTDPTALGTEGPIATTPKSTRPGTRPSRFTTRCKRLLLCAISTIGRGPSPSYSRAIDNVSEIFSTGGGGTTIAYAQNPLNTDVAERGVSGNSYPSVIGLQMVYSEPWFQGPERMAWAAARRLCKASTRSTPTTRVEPFDPYQFYTAQSPFVNPADSLAVNSFCDLGFSQEDFIGVVHPRPILSNPRAPLGSVAINSGAGGYINCSPGSPFSIERALALEQPV